jgi:cyclohexanecarboxylate-CoA ligase
MKARARGGVRATRNPPQAARYVEDGHWQGELLDDYILEAARRYPARAAIVDRSGALSFAELSAAIEQAAGMLARLGVGHGDVVSFQLPNWREAAIVHPAVVGLGAVSNPIIPIYRDRELRFVLGQARSRVLVIPDVFRRFDYRAMAERIRGELPDLEQVLVVGEATDGTTSFAGALERGGAVPDVTRDPGDIVLLLYTSGTEANPKGVLHSHNTLAYECRSMIDLLAFTQDDTMLMPSPVTHITGLLYGLQMPFMVGTGVVLQDVWDVGAAVELIEQYRCSVTIGATPFLHGLVTAEGLADHDVSSLRVFACGGADVPPSLIRAAHEGLHVTATRVYGSTECPTVTGTPLDAPVDRHAETDGRPFGPSEVRLLDDAGNEVAPEARGELQVMGPDLCLGYLDDSLNERSFTDDGWFRTGDLGVLDNEGYLRIAGRLKDVILRGGENLSAKEIEDLLFEHPDVDEVAVVGYPDPMLGERACAYVVSSVDLTLEELVEFLRTRKIANQKLPEQLRVVPELPKTASGKVQKYVLRDRIRSEIGERTAAVS